MVSQLSFPCNKSQLSRRRTRVVATVLGVGPLIGLSKGLGNYLARNSQGIIVGILSGRAADHGSRIIQEGVSESYSQITRVLQNSGYVVIHPGQERSLYHSFALAGVVTGGIFLVRHLPFLKLIHPDVSYARGLESRIKYLEGLFDYSNDSIPNYASYILCMTRDHCNSVVYKLFIVIVFLSLLHSLHTLLQSYFQLITGKGRDKGQTSVLSSSNLNSRY